MFRRELLNNYLTDVVAVSLILRTWVTKTENKPG